MKTQVLCNWRPRGVLTKDEIRRKFTKKLLKLGFRPEGLPRNPYLALVDVRAPYWHDTVNFKGADKNSNVAAFHKDGGLRYFVVWSNVSPTEVKFKDGSLLDAKDGDIIFVDNKEVMHRTPKKFREINRWFARAYLHD